MENKKNTLRLEYLPLSNALELYKQGIFVMGVFPTSSLEEDLAGVDPKLKDEFLSYYVSNLESGTFVYDMSIQDYEPELNNVCINGDTVEIKDIFSDEAGYNIETEKDNVVNYNTRIVYKDREVYENQKQKMLGKAKELTKTLGATLAAPITRYVVMKAKKVPDIDQVLEGGLYHFNSEKAADAILKSGYIKPSGRMTSYSMKKKTFFFGENPELQDVLYNCKDLQKHMTAIHVKYNEALERDIKNGKVQVRLDDGSICITGATKAEHGYEMEKVQMELVKDEKTNTFYYKNVTEKELTDFEISSSKETQDKLNQYLRIPKAIRGFATYPEIARRAVTKYINAVARKSKALPKGVEITNSIDRNGDNTLLNNLQDSTYLPEQVDRNYAEISRQDYEKQDRDLEV